MYIKNISQILNLKNEDKQNLTKGNQIYAKVLSLTDNKGVVQLQNGSFLPSVFLVNENIEENRTYRFQVKEYTEDKIVLEIVGKEGSEESKKSDITRILEKLNLSISEGNDIISKLIKFSIPAKDESILSIHNNYNFLKELKNLSTSELLNLISNLTGKTVTEDSNEFLAIKNIMNILNDVDLDFLTFLEQNKIPATLENILKVDSFMKNPLIQNDFITSIQSLNTEVNVNNLDFNFLDDSTVNNLSKESNISKDTLKSIINFIKDNNIDLNNITENQKNTIISLLSKDSSSPNKSFDVLTNSLKNLTILSDLSTKDDALSTKLIDSIKTSTGILVDKNSVKDISLLLKENPSLTTILKNASSESSDFLKLCQSITKNPNLTEDSHEFILLKEFSKGNLDEVLNIKYSRADKLESLIIKSFITESAAKGMVNGKISTMDLSLNTLKENPELASKLPQNILNLLNENVDINKYLSNNYTMFNFNFLTNENFYKNSIIIKNKHSSKYIDINDVKLYISVDTNNIGLVEGYVSKKLNDISVNLKANVDYIPTIKNGINKLQNKLNNMGYNVINVSVEPAKNSATILTLSDFFSDGTYLDLDVRA